MLNKGTWDKRANTKTAIVTTGYAADEKAWDKLVCDATHDLPHYMQSSGWSESKAHSPWPVSRCIATTSDGLFPLQVFSRTIPGLGRMHYAPQIVGITPANLAEITQQLKTHYKRSLTLKLELDQPYDKSLVDDFLEQGWVLANSVQYRDTVIIDLSGTEEAMFARVKPRGRHEIRVAQRNSVRVEKVAPSQENLDKMCELIRITGRRSGAFFRDDAYLNKYWHAFATRGQGFLYFAYFGDELLAGAYVITYGKNSWYKDGGSIRPTSTKTDVFAPRYLHWEIMRDLQSLGMLQYDMSGIPAPSERNTSSMRGLYAFKTAYSKETTTLMPAMELAFGSRYSVWPKTERQWLRLYSRLAKDFWY